MSGTTERDGYYYHAGAVWDTLGGVGVQWSDHTRRSLATAEAEARLLARRLGNSRPVVEWWEKEWGLRPGDESAACGSAFVMEE